MYFSTPATRWESHLSQLSDAIQADVVEVLRRLQEEVELRRVRVRPVVCDADQAAPAVPLLKQMFHVRASQRKQRGLQRI